MDTSDILKKFAVDLGVSDINIDETVKLIEKSYFPEVMKIFQKDATFFDTERTLFQANLSYIWKSATPEMQETIWKHLQSSMFASFLHGDIKEKVGTIIDAMKSMWQGKDDDVSKVLNDEASEGRFKEILDYIMNTRLAKMFMKLFEEFDISEFEETFTNPEDLLEIIKNPEHPIMQKFIGKVQNLVKDKIKRGEISQSQIMNEMEAIKAKLTSLFGNIFGDALGLNVGGGGGQRIPGAVMMGNSPEARRQRMLARLQKKQHDKNSR